MPTKMQNTKISNIITKLQNEFNKGIATEAQVVYLLVQIRKVLELQNNSEYNNLKFYCNWALHPILDRKDAQKFISEIDEAHEELCRVKELDNLSENIRKKLYEYIQMKLFKDELKKFIKEYDLNVENNNGDWWVDFLHLYLKVIEDCPLQIKSNSTSTNIKEVVVNIEMANEIVSGFQNYQVTWNVFGRSEEKSGKIYIFNSFKIQKQKAPVFTRACCRLGSPCP